MYLALLIGWLLDYCWAHLFRTYFKFLLLYWVYWIVEDFYWLWVSCQEHYLALQAIFCFSWKGVILMNTPPYFLFRSDYQHRSYRTELKCRYSPLKITHFTHTFSHTSHQCLSAFLPNFFSLDQSQCSTGPCAQSFTSTSASLQKLCVHTSCLCHVPWPKREDVPSTGLSTLLLVVNIILICLCLLWKLCEVFFSVSVHFNPQ